MLWFRGLRNHMAHDKPRNPPAQVPGAVQRSCESQGVRTLDTRANMLLSSTGVLHRSV